MNNLPIRSDNSYNFTVVSKKKKKIEKFKNSVAITISTFFLKVQCEFNNKKLKQKKNNNCVIFSLYT